MARAQPADAAAGIAAAAVGLGVAEVVAGALLTRSPVVAVADAVIELAPGAWERAAIDAVGQADKPILVVSVVAVTLLLGAVAGRFPKVAVYLVGGAAALGAWASVVEEDASWVHAFAPLVGGAAAAGTLVLLRRPMGRVIDAPLPPAALARRLLVAGSVATLTGVTGRLLSRRVDASGSRRAVVLPKPDQPLPPVPGSADLEVPGLSPFITPNADFYRIDTALLVPQVETEDWTLKISGMVDHPYELTYAELIDRPMVEADVTLLCVSNEVGGDLIGNARWLGVPLGDLLREASPQRRADQIVGRSVDGFTAGFPASAATDGRDALVAIAMNGEPLPLRHGFPARLVVGGLYGYVSATKWLSEIELTRFDQYDAYWIDRGWAQLAPVKVGSRIDTPRGRAAAGTIPVAGVAWAQGRGIGRVEVRVDDGRWRDAVLGAAVGNDTWRQWRWDWAAEAGTHSLTVRATTADGEVQTAERATPYPDGATGHHRVAVRVE